jgi:extradiol dioxygenase family protein
MPPIHFAIAVTDSRKARAFYGVLLGCQEGRKPETWVDYNLYG